MRPTEFEKGREEPLPRCAGPHPHPETRQLYLAQQNADLLDETGRQLAEALADGKIPPKSLPPTYKALAETNYKFESRGLEPETFGDALARSMRGTPPTNVKIIIERGAEVIDVVPVKEEGEE